MTKKTKRKLTFLTTAAKNDVWDFYPRWPHFNAFRIFIQNGYISCLWDFYPRWLNFTSLGFLSKIVLFQSVWDFYPRWLHFHTSTIKMNRKNKRKINFFERKEKHRLGFLSKIAPFHAFGIFIQDGPISMRLGFLSKMAPFPYATYKNDKKKKKN